MKKLLALTALAFLGSYSYAENWVNIFNYNEKSLESLYVDFDSIQTHPLGNGGIYVSAWTGMVFNPPTIIEGYEVARQTSHAFFDCPNQKGGYNYVEVYNPQNTMINQAKDRLSPHSSADWETIAPNTAGEQFFHAICSHVYR